MLLASCRKPAVVPTSDPAAAVATDSVTAGVEIPANPETTVLGENQRTRALPRPEDKKHAPPVIPVGEGAPVAVQVEGRPGFVMSPFNSKIVDVRDIPPGTLVMDPSFPATEKKYFRTP